MRRNSHRDTPVSAAVSTHQPCRANKIRSRHARQLGRKPNSRSEPRYHEPSCRPGESRALVDGIAGEQHARDEEKREPDGSRDRRRAGVEDTLGAVARSPFLRAALRMLRVAVHENEVRHVAGNRMHDHVVVQRSLLLGLGVLEHLSLKNERGRREILQRGHNHASKQPGQKPDREDTHHHGSPQWQGKLRAWRVSCAALWIVDGDANPTVNTSATPKNIAAKAALRTSARSPIETLVVVVAGVVDWWSSLYSS